MSRQTEFTKDPDSPWSAKDIQDLRRLQDALNRITDRATNGFRGPGFGGFTVFPPSFSHSASLVEVVPGLFLPRERREMQGPSGLPPAMSRALPRVLGE